MLYNSSILRSIIIAQHNRYWTCSRFADWLRGSPKPGAATSEGWDAWYAEAEAKYPVRYWIAEEGLHKLQDFVTWPTRKISDIRNYVTNRYVSKTHALTSTLAVGQWYEFETRVLYCMFGALANYIEIEEAWSYVCWGDDERKAKYKSTRRFWWNEWRCPEAGVDRLKWAASLVNDKDMGVAEDSPDYGKPTNQALHAQEILDLYTWWTVTRPARPDPWEVSGWNALHAARNAELGFNGNTKSKRRALRSKRTPEYKKESANCFALMGKIEAKYEKEDDQMLIRLIKARKGMWT